jgi:hypothetical protein
MAIDFSLSELVALSVESFFYGTLSSTAIIATLHHRVRALKQKMTYRDLLCALRFVRQDAPQ